MNDNVNAYRHDRGMAKGTGHGHGDTGTENPNMSMGYDADRVPVDDGDGYAIASMSCGIAAIVLSFTIVLGIVFGILAIVFFVLRNNRYKAMYGHIGGPPRVKEITGCICAAVGVGLSVLSLIAAIWIGAHVAGGISVIEQGFEETGESAGELADRGAGLLEEHLDGIIENEHGNSSQDSSSNSSVFEHDLETEKDVE